MEVTLARELKDRVLSETTLRLLRFCYLVLKLPVKLASGVKTKKSTYTKKKFTRSYTEVNPCLAKAD